MDCLVNSSSFLDNVLWVAPVNKQDGRKGVVVASAGDVLTVERNRLNPETAQKVLFLRENLPIVDFQY